MPITFKCVSLALFLTVIVVSGSDLKVNTYTKIEAHHLFRVGSWSEGVELIAGNGSDLSLYANVDIENATLSKATNFEKGKDGPTDSVAFDGSDAAYTSIVDTDSNDSRMVKLDSDLKAEKTFSMKVDSSAFAKGFGCQFSELDDGVWTCLTGTNVYQFDVSDKGEFSFDQSYSLEFSGSTSGTYKADLDVKKWIKSASGEYVAYGNTGDDSGLFIMSVAADFSKVTAGWAFGGRDLGSPAGIIEIGGVRGLFAFAGTTSEDDGFVAFIDLMTATTVDNYAFSTFDATDTTIISIAGTSHDNYIMTTQDTVTYFEYSSNNTYSSSWSKKLTSSVGECSVQEVFTQSSDNLLLLTLLPEENVSTDEDGAVQLAEMTYQMGEVADGQDELTVDDSGMEFTQIMYWRRGGEPAEISGQTKITKGSDNPWSSTSSADNPSQEDVDVSLKKFIDNPFLTQF